jgi:hypothetical protein
LLTEEKTTKTFLNRNIKFQNTIKNYI